MKLSQGEKIGLICAFGAVVLSAMIHIGIREWYQPDVRYEEGGYYIYSNGAITSVKLKNYGHSDAENISILARFSSEINDISIDNKTVKFNFLSGGIGKNHITMEIPRLVIDQEIFIYFSINLIKANPDLLSKGYLKEITFKGGNGKTGQPYFWGLILLISISLIIYYPLQKLIEKIAEKLFNKAFSSHYEKLNEIINLAKNAINENKSKGDFEDILNEHIEGIEFRKKTLREVGLKAFDAFK